MKIDVALDRLGATAVLSRRDRLQLDEQGYIVFDSLLNADDVDILRRRIGEIGDIGQDFVDYTDAIRMHYLYRFGDMFDRLWLDPLLLATTAHLMGGEFKLYQLNLRATRPGTPRQSLHVDSDPRADGAPHAALVNSIWMLDDFTAANGSTRLVPGSHRWNTTPTDLEDADAPHPMELAIEAPAGSLLIFSGHVWHRGGENTTSALRRGIFCSFHERHIIPPDSHLAFYEHHRPRMAAVETQSRFSEAATYILAETGQLRDPVGSTQGEQCGRGPPRPGPDTNR